LLARLRTCFDRRQSSRLRLRLRLLPPPPPLLPLLLLREPEGRDRLPDSDERDMLRDWLDPELRGISTRGADRGCDSILGALILGDSLRDWLPLEPRERDSILGPSEPPEPLLGRLIRGWLPRDSILGAVFLGTSILGVSIRGWLP
jgi:hypothetical protein